MHILDNPADEQANKQTNKPKQLHNPLGRGNKQSTARFRNKGKYRYQPVCVLICALRCELLL